MSQSDSLLSFRKLLCVLLTVVTIVSCNTSSKLVSSEYQSEITAHRQKTESGLITGGRAPLKQDDLTDLRYFPLNADYKVVATLTLAEGESPFELPTYSGITKTYIKYATLSFSINKVNHSLNLYKNLENLRMPQYKDYLFLPYKDFTNGESTYGGGRYINVFTYDIVDGKLMLDFNKSYNPWCAYSDGYNCPIPPIENHLEIEINAGEMNFAGKKKSVD